MISSLSCVVVSILASSRDLGGRCQRCGMADLGTTIRPHTLASTLIAVLTRLVTRSLAHAQTTRALNHLIRDCAASAHDQGVPADVVGWRSQVRVVSLCFAMLCGEIQASADEIRVS